MGTPALRLLQLLLLWATWVMHWTEHLQAAACNAPDLIEVPMFCGQNSYRLETWTGLTSWSPKDQQLHSQPQERN